MTCPRIHTHVYAKTAKEVLDESIELYKQTVTRCRIEGITIAPFMLNGGKEKE